MENLKTLAVPVTLKATNYLLWSRMIKTALMGRGLWKHITEDEASKSTALEGDTEVVNTYEEKWLQEDMMVLSILQGSLETSILEAYSYCETPKDLWETLQKVYGNVSNLNRVFEVKKAINGLVQDDLEFTQHLGKFRSLWSELEMLRPSSTDPDVLNERREQDKVFGLLLTLNPMYNDLIKHLLRAEKLPSLEEVCSQVQKEQGSLGLFGGKGTLSMASKAEAIQANKVTYGGQGGGRKVCDHCKRKGHLKDKCWILHPHLKPQKFMKDQDGRAHAVEAHDQGGSSGVGPSSHQTMGEATGSTTSLSNMKSPGDELVKRSELDALIKALKEHGNPLGHSHLVYNVKTESDFRSKTHHSDITPRNAKMENGYSHAASMITRPVICIDKPHIGVSYAAVTAHVENGKSLAASNMIKPVIVDSGASHHMISDVHLIKDIEPAVGYVMIANGDKIPIRGIGNLQLFEKQSRAFYMPEFTSNLLSVKRVTTDLNCRVIFDPNTVKFQDIESKKVIGNGGTNGELYVLEDLKTVSNHNVAFKSSISGSKDNALWHARLGHPHMRALNLIFPSVSFDNNDCEACVLGKHCKTVFPKSSTVYENCFDLIHSDVWTAPCLSREQQKYYVTFIDQKSKYTWVTLLRTKDRVLEAFKNFVAYITNQYNAKPKILRSDNGGEYTSNAFKEYLAQQGIVQQTTCPYTPEQNGVAERKNRHLMEVARSMLFHTHVPKRFWNDAVVTACYLINRTPTRILNDLSPYEVLNKTKPRTDHLRVFGCRCFVMVPRELRNKLEAKSTKAMFIGYSPEQKGYKCIIPSTGKVMVSREVKFMEDQGYYEEGSWEDVEGISQDPSCRAQSLRHILESLGIGVSQDQQASNQDHQHPTSSEEAEEAEGGEEGTHLNHEGGNDEAGSDSDSASHAQDEVLDQDDQDQDDQDQDDQSSDDNEEPNEASQPEAAQPLRRSTRIKFPPSNWKNTRVYFNSNAVAQPFRATCSLASYPSEHQAFIVSLDDEQVPRSIEEAMSRELWKGSVHEEMGAMERNNTWYETTLPKGKKAVTSRMIFTIKYLPNGKIERRKSRLVARGFTQKYGEDYVETFAPVAKLHTIRIVLSIATNMDWDLWQMDVKNAFLQGELEDEVYMLPPPGLEGFVQPGRVLRLKKAIYGLKQSPRAWYTKLSTTLNGKGFIKAELDHTLFTFTSPRGIVVLLVYVDDIIITGSDKVGIQETKDFLKSVFDIKDLGELKYFLGIEICRSKDGLFLSQRKYTRDMLKLAGKQDAKPAKSPLEEGYKVLLEGEIEDNQPFKNDTLYRKMVGKLIYLTITRPDICFAVNQVSQHMKAPKQHHWNMVDRIMRYLSGSTGQGVWMGRNDSVEVVGYCDADWAGDRTDRRSTTGYCTFIGGNLTTWKSKKQKVVSCSSAEAEYRAMRSLTNELVWIKGMMKSLGLEITTPITMHCDNQAAIHIASNSVFHERTKHIEVDCHKVRQMVVAGVILPCYTRSEDQLADIFTKAVRIKVLESIISRLGLLDLSRP